MLSLSARKPLDNWSNNYIAPGPVGSVGDANLQSRLKSSLPGEFRWEKKTYGKNEPSFGSNVSDGTDTSFSSGGGPARTMDNFWGGRRDMSTSRGWKFQNLRPEDVQESSDPVMGALPQLSWKMQLAAVKDRQRTGNLFRTRRGGLIDAPRGPVRGGNVPTVVAQAGEDNINLLTLGNPKVGLQGGLEPEGRQIINYGAGGLRGGPSMNGARGRI